MMRECKNDSDHRNSSSDACVPVVLCFVASFGRTVVWGMECAVCMMPNLSMGLLLVREFASLLCRSLRSHLLGLR